MIKNEQQLKQESIKTAVVGAFVALVLSIFTQKFNIIGGYLLGSVFAYGILNIDCKSADGILRFQTSRPYLMTFVFFLFKLGIYAIGFLMAVKIPVIFNLFSVFAGYLTIKLTIYRLALTRR